MSKTISRQSIIYQVLYDTKKGEANLKRTTKAVQSTEKATDSFGKTLKKATAALGGLFAARAIGEDAASTIINFEKALSSLRAITGVTKDELKFFAEAARDMARTTIFSAQQAVQAYELIGSAAPELLKNKEALTAVAKEAAILAEAAEIELPDAARALTTAMNQMNIPAERAREIIDTLAAGSLEGAANIPYLTNALDKVGSVAESAGLTFQETTAGIEVLAKKIPEASMAGIQFRNVLLQLNKKAKDEFNPSVVGLSKALKNLEKAQLGNKELGRLVNDENIVAIQTLIGMRDEYERLTEEVGVSGTALKQQEIQTDNIAGAMARLRNAWDDIVLGFSEGTSPIKNAINFLADNLEEIVKIVSALVAGFLAYKAVMLASKVVTNLLNVATTIYRLNMIRLSKGIKGATIAMRAFNTASKANVIGAVVGLIASAVVGFFSMREEIDGTTTSLDKFKSAVADINVLKEAEHAINKLYAGMDISKTRTESLKKAIELLNEQIDRVDREKIKIIINDKIVEVDPVKEIKGKIKIIELLKAELEMRDKITKKPLPPEGEIGGYAALKKQIADITKVLQDQAVAQNISQDTVDKYLKLVERLELAEAAFKRATDDTNKSLKIRSKLLDDILDSSKDLAKRAPLIHIPTHDEEVAARQEVADSIIDIARHTEFLLFDIQTQFLERRLERMREQTARELELVGNNEAEKQRLLHRSAREEAIIQRKIALAKKTSAVFDIAITLAEAVFKIKAAAAAALNPAVKVLQLAQIPLVIASAGVQTAFVLSQPLPEFKKGTPDAPGGMARVGEAGEEIVMLPEHSKVLNNEKTRLFDALVHAPNLNVDTINKALVEQGLGGSNNFGGGKDYQEQFYRQWLATKKNNKVSIGNTKEFAREVAQQLSEAESIHKLYE